MDQAGVGQALVLVVLAVLAALVETEEASAETEEASVVTEVLVESLDLDSSQDSAEV